MQQNLPLYQYLYQSLVSQLECGVYLNGQTLPTQQQICRQYNLGITTVRKAMRLLESGGYVHTALGQPAIVTYAPPQASYIAALAARREAIADTYKGLGLLLPALYREGAKRCQEAEFRQMQKAIDDISDDTALPQLYRQANIFFRTVHLPLHNPLSLELELDAENFLQVPYIPLPNVDNPFFMSARQVKTWLQAAKDQIEQKQYDRFYDSVCRFYRKASQRVDQYFQALQNRSIRSAHPERNIRWFRVKGRSELYAHLAMTILRRIVGSEFDSQKFLPSLSKTMEEYGVTKETASRTFALLNALGVTETINKKGTVIVRGNPGGGACSVDFNNPVIRQRLLLFQSALQMILLTVHDCATALLPVPKDMAADIENKLNTVSSSRISPLSVQLLMDILIQLSPCHSLKNIYLQLNDFLIWGYYLFAIDESLYVNDGKTLQAMKDVAACLQGKGSAALPDILENAFSQIYQDIHTVVSCLPISEWLSFPIEIEKESDAL